MNKKMLKLALASLVLTSCASNEEIVDNNQTPVIEQPEVIQLEQLKVTYNDGNELLITQPEFLVRFAKAIINQYEEVKSESNIWETYCTIEMNENTIEMMTPFEIKINGKDYKYVGNEQSILWDVIYAHSFESKGDNPAYLKTTQVATIEEWLDGIRCEREENVICITDIGAGGMFT